MSPKVESAQPGPGPRRQALTLWFTGLSGAGKSTVAYALEGRFRDAGISALVLDGDAVRAGLCRDLGFTPEDRAENARRVAEVARLLNEAGVVAICALISPFAVDRKRAREIIGAQHFIEIFVDTPLAVCAERDTKGLYAMARKGALGSLTGVHQAYEPPAAPDLRVTTVDQTVAQSADRVFAAVQPRLAPNLGFAATD